MSYRPPDYNLLANIWTCDGTVKPANGAPDFFDVPVQKYVASRSNWPTTPPWSAGFYLTYVPPIQLRFQHVSPFSGTWRAWKVTCVEVPAGSGQYYRTFWGEIQHEGFINEYVLVVGVQCNEELLAIPPPGSTEAVGVSADACGNLPPADPPTPKLPPGPWPPPPLPPPADFEDDFVDTAATPIASHVATSGEAWTLGTGSLEIGSGGFGVVATGALGYSYATANYNGSHSSTISMDFTTPADLTNGMWVGVILRAVDDQNWHAITLQYDGTSPWLLNLYICTAGSVVNVANGSTLINLTPSTMYAITVEMVTNNMIAKLILAGTPIATENFTSAVDVGVPGLGVFIYEDGVMPSPLITDLSR